MKSIAISFIIFFVCITGKSQDRDSNYREVLLPDGAHFTFWDDETIYQKTLWVDQNNPVASDDNEGTILKPYKTISKAASVLKPGEKVIVKQGVYRENVRPARGGDSSASMIFYEASPGEQVIISGSEILKEKWVTSRTPYKPSQVFSNKLWMTSVPYSYFNENIPFRTQNLDSWEISVMGWAKDWENRVPYSLCRGLVFQNGKRMTQLSSYEDIVKIPGSYWVDTSHNEQYAFNLHIHPFNEANPNSETFEITARQSPFNPMKKGVNFVRVKGFIIEEAGNGFQVAGKGAFSTFGSRNWIIEQNIIRKINSVGLEIGGVTNRHIESEKNREEFENVSGRHIIRNNTIYDCGTGGIQGLINRESLVEMNHIYNIGWQDAEFYYETAAIKLHMTHNCLVRGNHIHDVDAAMGIWLDAGNINSRVTQNLIYNVNCNFGGIFMEISYRPNLVDNNLIWNCSKNGIYQHDCDSLIIVHNIVGRSRENGIMMKTNKGRQKGKGEYTTARYNKIMNNILIDNNVPFSYSDTMNISDQNIISNTLGSVPFNWDLWLKSGFDRNSKEIKINASFDPVTLILRFKTEVPLPVVERLPFINEDLVGRKYDAKYILPGALLKGKAEKLDRYFDKQY